MCASRRDTHDPVFKKTFTVYQGKSAREFRFAVYDVDEGDAAIDDDHFIGAMDVTMESLLAAASSGKPITGQLRNSKKPRRDQQLTVKKSTLTLAGALSALALCLRAEQQMLTKCSPCFSSRAVSSSEAAAEEKAVASVAGSSKALESKDSGRRDATVITDEATAVRISWPVCLTPAYH